MLTIPAAMAFGTGDHATTSTCLRMLCDAAAAQPAGWEMLDLGTGTGILALAGRLLGAARCDAFDFDPACIRAARENARQNGIRQVAVTRADVLEWIPARQWYVVTANLYSEVLLKVARQDLPDRAARRAAHSLRHAGAAGRRNAPGFRGARGEI